ncbi:TetR/AcrR family transcriptional regulator [Streptomyces atratus]|uniref:TetR/AcrR family transcriptional regulator n=1 Tax=Streptomyces atratus TaxID=1893 RepID=UPI0022502F73|nr:TetR/AcrR family transcriptional regulator [Streptomyces atratus]MCX5341730.1 TetR/AcrR family transcriptional regulator [Streptomyces atratus]
MGNREDLLAGAKKCLYEKGYARTTARDIVAASGVGLASIGYHFGSKEALLSEAVMEAFEEWGDELRELLADTTRAEPASLDAAWERVSGFFVSHRPLLLAGIEAFAQANRVPGLREQLAEAYERARMNLALPLRPETAGASDEKAERAVGSFHLAVISGLGLQWLLDPEGSPSGAELAQAMRLFVKAADAG